MNILLTGANGFVGQHFLQCRQPAYTLIPVSVREDSPLPDFTGVDAVVHLGGKAHEMNPLPDSVYFNANAELTKRLATAAKAAGVAQFVYISSVKVYGNVVGENMDETTPCHPDDAYGKSKLLAEHYLHELADEHFVVSIVRPPLVYGAGVKGNMLKLMQLAQKNIPLPFGNIRNRRSLVYVGNLIALIHNLLRQKEPGVYIAGDAAPLSTTQLVALIRKYSAGKTGWCIFPALYKRW